MKSGQRFLTSVVRITKTLIILLVVYVLSIGPVDTLYFHNRLSPTEKNAYMQIYDPLGRFCSVNSIQGRALHQYCIWWRRVPEWIDLVDYFRPRG